MNSAEESLKRSPTAMKRPGLLSETRIKNRFSGGRLPLDHIHRTDFRAGAAVNATFINPVSSHRRPPHVVRPRLQIIRDLVLCNEPGKSFEYPAIIQCRFTRRQSMPIPANNKPPVEPGGLLFRLYPVSKGHFSSSTACAAASRAIGTRNGEQET